MYHPPRPRIPEQARDLVDAGVSTLLPPFLISRALSGAIRFGIGPSLTSVLGPQELMVYTRYWHPRHSRTPSISFIYDLVFEAAPSTVEDCYRARLARTARSAIRRSTMIAVISKTVERELHAGYPETVGRTAVLPPGFSSLPESTPADARMVLAQLGLNRGYLLHVGTLEPRKNLLRLVRALRQIPPLVWADRHLVLVGPPGWQDGDLRDAMALAGDDVRHVPFVTDTELRVLYENAALLVFPSLYEGFGLPVLEAMGLGTPVVCSAIPVLEEVCGGAAITFDPHDEDAIAEALAAVLTDQDHLTRLSLAGLDRARHYDWEETGGRFVKALHELAQSEICA